MYSRHHGAAGPASHRGAPEPDRARRAPPICVICTGAELEIGWLPLLLTQSGNAGSSRVRPATSRRRSSCVKLEIPKVIDRALGDMHPAGNPHIQTRSAQYRARWRTRSRERLAQLDPANAAYYRTRGKAFRAALAGGDRSAGKPQAAPLKGVPIVVYHKDLSYLDRLAGHARSGQPRAQARHPADAGHLAELVDADEARSRRRSSSTRRTTIRRRRSSCPSAPEIPAVMLPFTVGGTDKAKDLFGLFDDTIARLLAAVEMSIDAADLSASCGRRCSPACWSPRPTCRWACRCSSAASCSSTSPSRRSPAWA